MAQKISPWNFFRVGGTLHRHAPSYVKRPVDDLLLERVLAGQFCYVLAPRQMGKSSLMVRTAERLKSRQIKTVLIDLTEIGRVTRDQWYPALLNRMARKLKLSVSPDVWWQEQAELSVAKRFIDYLHLVVLSQVKGQVVVFIDEINATLAFDFTDHFFAAIRAMYEARGYNRLTFVLLGVASDEELIKERTSSPFELGYPIVLSEFSLEEAHVLQHALEQIHPNQGELIFKRIYHWTSGQPYLTQKLCLAAAQTTTLPVASAQVDQLVRQLFLRRQWGQEINLRSVQDQILLHKETQKLLDLYSQIYHGTAVRDEQQSAVKKQLKLSGLVRDANTGGYLKISNPIYRHAFDQAWIQEKRGTYFVERKTKSVKPNGYLKLSYQ